MPHLKLRGVTLDFPFTPYPCQEDYMSKVIECLQNKVNGVLESPTGTGKTLCLLCATLGWREYFKDTISARKIAERMGGTELFQDRPLSSWGTAATDGDTPTYYTDIPKIIYASRTHSQLTQVITELKNTSYRPKVCVLGSREQLCINQEVMRHESNHIKVHMCRAKVSTRSCVFYNNVDEKSTDKEIMNSILDVEDLVKTGKKQRVCPYYLSRSIKQHADIIFMPYNYLLDPKSRRAHNIELKGAVVIFDEAHNVEKMCEESTSFDLTPYDIISAIEAVDRLLREQASDISKAESAEDFNVESLNSGLKLDITTIAKIKQILMDLESAINGFEMPANNQGITKPGSFIYELFQKAHLNFDTKTATVEAMEQITGYLAGKPGVFLNTSGLQKVADIIQLVFGAEPTEDSKKSEMGNSMKEFKVHIHPDTSNFKKKQNTDVWASSSSNKQGNVLSYWCFSPGFSMQDLLRQGVRSIILTSGTLSPLSSFTYEMQIPFPISLENPHVIQRDQIFVSIIDKGPDGVQLSTAFDRRFVPENMSSIGNTVVNLTKVVPHGLLVFFPSYPVMDKTLEFWRANGHADRIEHVKPMFIEPRGKSTFTEVIDGYYDKVNDPKSSGGSFFAVCRGKASEGLDFADTYGRGVVITGLPFPPRMDPRVVLKMQYLDEMCKNKTSGVKYLSGQEWYRQQASRAVNQAIGRVIRHREDYGAIFLCDHRFKGTEARKQLPSWVRPYVKIYDSFGAMVRDVAHFFRTAQKARPVPVKKGRAVGSENQASLSTGSSFPAKTHWLSDTSQKAKALDSHVPSLKRRKLELDEHSGRDGAAKLCIQYEMEMTSKRKPISLLDALDDSTNKETEDTMVGEERASRLSTLSLQYDKRLDDESRGGKRKIKVVHDRKEVASCSAKTSQTFMIELRRCLSHENFKIIMEALQAYKATDDLSGLLTNVIEPLIQDPNTHSLLRGLYQFIRPHHKKKFDERCWHLTGEGCGYKPEHSLSREERGALRQNTAKAETSLASSASEQLDLSQQLNQGGSHLETVELNGGQGKIGVNVKREDQKPQASIKDSLSCSSLLSDIRQAIGAEKTRQMFLALQAYKATNNYEQMVSTVVSLLTERDEDINLLARLAVLIRPQHRKQFGELLKSLTGNDSVAYQDLDVSSSQPNQASQLSAGKTQSKISFFFS
ncbi:regulator of telomere elongation helicase 1 [Xyrauchen texanus]|uniref:regulator of telomere elongation helicase 1 n=1 Tax=Xyrauchen texanus TaxID=154827 RepID=UPI002242801A|nr:regulator of telomere elongation helicase 1 [Xyrauchen texanus]XP_051967243.1 regulator of telomere elongation helicase 1 [Xyrauchen texanus]XP_051967244.1 regulator of telomere elongation helicase 1 [Xyrauchen texanus]XP_051967245.1 regulator of telomere elongation helicase 1 [Xyrauchen texanus]